MRKCFNSSDRALSPPLSTRELLMHLVVKDVNYNTTGAELTLPRARSVSMLDGLLSVTRLLTINYKVTLKKIH